MLNRIIHTGLVFSLMFQGCSDRERLNPLDPLNSHTHGTPVGLQAVALRDTVIVTWDEFAVNDMQEYILYRGFEGGSLQFFTSLSPESLSTMDTSVEMDRTYEYAVQAVTAFDSSAISDPVNTVPGPYNLWVADHYGYALYQITYDGTNIIRRFDFTSPTAIAWDSDYFKLWIADYFAGVIHRISRAGDHEVTIDLPAYPVDLVWSDQHQTLYAILVDSTLRSFDFSGNLLGSLNLDQAITVSTSMVIDESNAEIWISHYQNNQVSRVNIVEPLSSNTTIISWPIEGPGPLDIDPVDGVWIASDRGIVHLKANSDTVVNRLFPGWVIYDLSIHREARRLLYTGRRLNTREWKTGSLPLQQPEESQEEILLGAEYPDLYNLQTIPASTGETGFIVQQSSPWRLLRFSPDGTLIGELPNFNSRLDFALY